jgi:hypothetical protein
MSGASINYGKTLFRLIEIVRMYYDTSLKTSRRDWSELSTPGRPSRFFCGTSNKFNKFVKKKKSKGGGGPHSRMVRLETLFRALLDAPDRGISLSSYYYMCPHTTVDAAAPAATTTVHTHRY